jgi:hypothetical protein
LKAMNEADEYFTEQEKANAMFSAALSELS